MNRRKDPRLHGVFCPVVTPLDGDEQLDESALRRQVDRVLAAGDSVMALGTSGELPILPAPVADRVLEVIADQVAGRTTLVCGVGDVGTERAVANVHRAHRHGADLVAVTAPYYYPVDEDSTVRHYREVADASPVPVVLYNIPVNTHRPLTRSIVERLADHENIVGIKDSGGDPGLFRWLLGFRDDTGLAVMQGTDEGHAIDHWRAGIDGYVSGLENLAPGTMLALADALARGDEPAAEAAQSILSAVMAVMDDEFWLSVLKAGVALQGIGSGGISRPLPPAAPAARERLRAALESHGLLPTAPTTVL